ncbi:hypothetical protein ABU178_04645 [Pantoea osteomyelitidis]|uniref:Uncharacterized protein n=1 Tax=Pantoea osteomyelitidis TaxID=3230026 RepID=A0ABW7PUJ3_9GAMM
MTRAILLALGLLMVAGPVADASTTGSIAVKLTIFSRCKIEQGGNQNAVTAIDCGRHFSAQPRVTQSNVTDQSTRKTVAKLVTIEW